METTAEMVEERLREMQDRGVLKPDELDEHAEAQLRRADPDIALEALSQWETSSFKRRNPSACMVSLLKKLNEQGLDLGPSGAVEPDVAAQQQAEDLMSEMSDKIDASATRQLRGLEPTEALAILTELRHADGIRNPSAFIMSAVKRCNNQGRSSGSRRRDPPRLQQGPHAEEDDGYGYGGFGYDVDNVYGGDDYESHSDRRHGNNQDRSRDNRVYGSYDYGSDSDRYGRYDGGGSGYDRNDRGYEDQSYYEDRGSGRRSHIEELMEGLNIDKNARDKLTEVPEESQVELLEELKRDAGKVRNHSAFICSNVKRIKNGTYRSRNQPPDERGGDDYGEQSYSYSTYSFSRHREDRDNGYDNGYSNGYDNGYGNDYGTGYGTNEEDDRQWPPSTEELRSSLDHKAQAKLSGISSEDAESLLQELQSKSHNVRNSSAWICAKVKTMERHYQHSQEKHNAKAKERSRSRRRGGINLTGNPAEQEPQQAQAGEFTEEQCKTKVLSLVESSELLNDMAKAALKAVPPLQGLEVFHEVVAEDNANMRNPSAFVIEKCREIAQQNGMEAEFLKVTATSAVRDSGAAPKAAAKRPLQPQPASEAEVTVEVPVDWRSMPLDQWLRSVDNGKGFLLKYQEALCKNFDDLEQVMDLYVRPPDAEGNVEIDQTFFDDLQIEKVGHMRLFQKWFKEQWNS